jgi:hypothetical protein
MKALTHPAMTALGVTSLCLMSEAAPLISPSHLLVYHLSAPSITAYGPVAFSAVLMWAILFGLLNLVDKRSERARAFVWSGLLLLLPGVLLKNISKAVGWKLYPHTSVIVLAASATFFVLLQFAWGPSFTSTSVRIRHVAMTVFGFVALSGIAVLGQVLWFGWQGRHLNTPRPLHHRDAAQAAASPQPRVIWILFDELSFRQTYEHRLDGLQLPAFDQLASQATVFTHVAPAGDRTRAVIPALMTGIAVDRIRSTAAGDLWIHDSSTGKWQPFDPGDTIFQQALADGHGTGIAGWYNPYCRILPRVLDRCFWTYRDPDTAVSTGRESLPMQLVQPVRELFQRARFLVSRGHGNSPDDIRAAETHTADYTDLYVAADDMLNDPSVTFLFLHMPVPHPWGFYSRRQRTFTTGRSSYIDNLALADRYLAHVHDLLERRGEWNSSAVIVMGDHSWRTTTLWEGTSEWTAEDETASEGGRFDDRPAYVVKLPNQQNPARVDAPWAAIRTRALLEQLLRHNLGTSDDVATWAARNPDANPRALASIRPR